MKRSTLLSAAGVTVLLGGASSAKAVVDYSFDNASLNGFTILDDSRGTASLSESTTTGVTTPPGALQVHVGPYGGGFDQIDFATSTVPADLVAPTTTSLSLDAAANYNNAAYITVAPEFFINGTTDGTAAFGTTLLFPNKTLPYDGGVATDRTDTFSLLIKDPFATARAAGFFFPGSAATPADGDSTTTTYTPGHIVAQISSAVQSANPNGGAVVSSFGFQEFTNTTPDGDPTDAGFLPDLGDDLFIDNVTDNAVATPVPEPASVGVLAVGGLALVARRRRRA